MQGTMMDEILVNECNISILVKDAYKRYSHKSLVLRGINMHVKEGTIYSLLGPSGCGKTTLLNALVGRLNLDAGTIKMVIKSKEEIGYMPQAVSLYQEFSISEQMTFYGHLYSMDVSSINERTNQLLKLFVLPPKESIISELSGGQQRRISLCIALLHNPHLLILDEPTVGLDVVLCNEIWEYLFKLTLKERKTIVITTHYIEEARHSQCVGLMRNGRILVEDEPNNLMELNNSTSMEQVFLKLCEEDNYREDEDEDVSFSKEKQVTHLIQSGILNFNRVYAYMLKNIFWMKRNIPMMLFTLVLPIVQCTLISVTVGEDPTGLRLGVVNDEVLEGHRNCSLKLPYSCTTNEMMSCQYLDKLQRKSLQIKHYDNLNFAKQKFKKNDIWGILYFNTNFTEYFLKRITEMDIASNDVINRSEIKLWLDQSNQVVAEVLKRHITDAMMEFSKDIWQYCNLSVTGTDTLIHYEKPVFGSMQHSFRQFMTPANAVLFEFFLPIMFTVGALQMEKTSGLLERCLVAGISLLEIALGHIVLQLLILTIQTGFLMIVLYYIFDNPLEGDVTLCLVLLILIGICGMFYGFFIASICRSFTTASYLAVGSYFPLYMLSGAIWPVEGMHYILRYASFLLPTTSSVESFRALSFKSWSMINPVVYGAFISLSTWSIILCLFAFLAVKYYGF